MKIFTAIACVILLLSANIADACSLVKKGSEKGGLTGWLTETNGGKGIVAASFATTSAENVFNATKSNLISIAGIGENQTDMDMRHYKYTYGSATENLGSGSTPTSSAPAPEPTTLLLLGSGLFGIAALRKKSSGKS